MLVVEEAELRTCVDMPEAIEAMQAAFAALGRGEAELPPPIGLQLPGVHGEVHVKGAFLHGAPVYAFKVASGFYDNAALGLPTGAGLMLAFNATTGAPEGLLLDNGYLTDLRTGAAGAVAARWLAPQEVGTALVVGTGVQARMQLRALMVVREPRRILIWGRDPGHAAECARDLADELDRSIEVAGDLEQAVRQARLIITVTPSREPLIRCEWLGDGTHVTAVGSDGPGKQELEPELLQRADRVVADRLAQCRDLGEIQHALRAGVVNDADIDELGDLVLGRVPGRRAVAEVTVADLTGVGVQDAAIAGLALARARQLGLGKHLGT